jgi:hypothetical protein
MRGVTPSACMLALVIACRAETIRDAANLAPGLDECARVCARVASCAHAHDPTRLRDPSTCVDWLLTRAPRADGTMQCLRGAPDCAAVDQCLHQTGDGRAMADCAAHPGAPTLCEGNDVITCGTDEVAESSRRDCSPLGATCRELVETGGLITHACAESKLCAADEASVRCDGPNAVLSCHDGAIERALCGAGTVCQAHDHADGSHYAMCEGREHVECAAPGTRRCDGDTLVTCEAHGHFSHGRTTNCRALGLSCEESRGGASCAAQPIQCAPGPPQCEGEALSFCAAGRSVRVSCGALGLGPCDPDARGPLAACTVAKGSALR